MDDRVVITGTGLISAIGNSPQEVWEALLSGKHGIRRIEGFEPSGFACRVGAWIKESAYSELSISPKDARVMDKHSYMLLKCTQDAFNTSCVDRASLSGDEVGFFAGMGMVDYNIADLLPAVVQSRDVDGALDYGAFYSVAYREIYPLWPLAMMNNIAFCQVAIALGIRGENAVFSPHADSGAQAIIEALETLRERKAEVALAGGVSEKISPVSLARAHMVGILNTSNLEDQQLCRPFDRQRNGTVLGEGCGMLCLQLQTSTENCKLSPKAVIAAHGSAFQLEESSYAPTAKAIAQAMNNAIISAELKPSDIDLVIAHGDGTVTGDKNETEALHRVFSGCLDKLKVFSSKGALGHLLAAAPPVDTILAVSMLEHNMIPATLHVTGADSNVEFNLVKESPLKTKLNRIMINSQSHEGQCQSLIIEALT